MITKITKTITISRELTEEIDKVKNFSALVEGLLRDYIGRENLKKLSIPELSDRLNRIKKIKEIKTELEELENENKTQLTNGQYTEQ